MVGGADTLPRSVGTALLCFILIGSPVPRALIAPVSSFSFSVVFPSVSFATRWTGVAPALLPCVTQESARTAAAAKKERDAAAAGGTGAPGAAAVAPAAGVMAMDLGGIGVGAGISVGGGSGGGVVGGGPAGAPAGIVGAAAAGGATAASGGAEGTAGGALGS